MVLGETQVCPTIHQIKEMKLNLTVFYTDGTSGIIEIEKPPGAHPESNMTMQAGVQEAEKGGKVVAKIGRSKINPHSVPGKNSSSKMTWSPVNKFLQHLGDTKTSLKHPPPEAFVPRGFVFIPSHWFEPASVRGASKSTLHKHYIKRS